MPEKISIQDNYSLYNKLLTVFVLFMLAIILYILLRFMDSDCFFRIFKLVFIE